MEKRLMFFVLSLFIALGARGEASALDLCTQTQTKLQNLISAAEACSSSAPSASQHSASASTNCWSAFFQPAFVPGNARRGLGVCSATNANNFVCTPEGGGPVTTVLVCGHPGGDCSVVACCASDDGCFIYRNL